MRTCRSLTSQKEKPGSASALSALRRTQRCPHLDLGLPASGTETRIHFLSSKPPALWDFVTAAVGNEYTQRRPSSLSP